MQKQEGLVDTDELLAFDTVATKRSFSLAAAEIGCSQSTISQRIARLEKRLNRILIRRTTRTMSLTPEGEAMLIYARSILAIDEDARMRLSHPSVKGVLKVGIEDEFARTKLPLVLGIFRSQFPNFGLRFVTGRNEHLRDVLREHEVDLVLGKSHANGMSQVLWEEQLEWFGRPIGQSKPSDPVPLITYLGQSITRDIVETALLAARRTWVVVAECSNLLGVIAAAEAGMGVMAIGRSFRASSFAQTAEGMKTPEGMNLPALGTLGYVLEGGLVESNPAAGAFRGVLGAAARQLASGKV